MDDAKYVVLVEQSQESKLSIQRRVEFDGSADFIGGFFTSAWPVFLESELMCDDEGRLFDRLIEKTPMSMRAGCSS